MKRPFDELFQLNLQMRVQLERAEAIMPMLNQQIDQLARLSWLPPTAFLSDLAVTRPYAAGSGRYDSCQLLQAALLVPGGYGLVVSDLEVYLVWQKQPEIAFEELQLGFLPFDQCSDAEKALLFPEAQALLRQLCSLILPAARISDFGGA